MSWLFLFVCCSILAEFHGLVQSVRRFFFFWVRIRRK